MAMTHSTDPSTAGPSIKQQVAFLFFRLGTALDPRILQVAEHALRLQIVAEIETAYQAQAAAAAARQ